MKVLEGLFYTKEHEWVKVKGKKAYIGITDYAQKALGNIVYVELPEEEEEFEINDTFGVVESVKAASDLYIPISGTVVKVNEALEDEPELINSDAFDNWIICVEIADKEELEDLMDWTEYEKYCSKEA